MPVISARFSSNRIATTIRKSMTARNTIGKAEFFHFAMDSAPLEKVESARLCGSFVLDCDKQGTAGHIFRGSQQPENDQDHGPAGASVVNDFHEFPKAK